MREKTKNGHIFLKGVAGALAVLSFAVQVFCFDASDLLLIQGLSASVIQQTANKPSAVGGTNESLSTTTKNVAVRSVKLNKKTASVTKGKTITLKATVSPSNAANKAVTWSSSNKKVATVKKGVVKGIKAGKATITVTTRSGKKKARCVVTVKNPVAAKLTVINSFTGKKVTGTRANILSQIVMAEVGGFNNAEVYKAQAVAAHAYIQYYKSLGLTASLPMRTPTAAVKNAVSKVANKTLTYKGGKVLASYYASNNGFTNNCKDIWGSDIPYLRSVPSPYDKTLATRTGTITSADLRNRIIAIYGSDITAGKPEKDWIKITGRNAAGYVTSVSLCGRTPKVEFFYQTILRHSKNGSSSTPIFSPDFTFKYSNGKWTFTSKGWGHGVGMSQHGAYGMALEGKTYNQILLHYYPGTKLANA